jgi:hypothetical protein
MESRTFSGLEEVESCSCGELRKEPLRLTANHLFAARCAKEYLVDP